MNHRSRASFLGLPLLHVATGAIVDGRYQRGVAVAWIAVGDIALGGLLALGGIACGGVSLGGVSVGVLSFGGLALGLCALGGLALGWIAVGGGAIAWYAAIGGFALAHDYAAGGVAHAQKLLAHVPGSVPFSSIPQPPFRVLDALLLLAIVPAAVAIVRAIRRRREPDVLPRDTSVRRQNAGVRRP